MSSNAKLTGAAHKGKGDTMNDTDLLEAAAKVAGIPLKSDFKERFDYYMQDRLMWNPLRGAVEVRAKVGAG